MTVSPLVAVYMSAAIAATVIGLVALWARLGAIQRTHVHRAFGYAWVTLMIVTAVLAPRRITIAGVRFTALSEG
jgi:uncharacterized membrane protein